MAHDEQWLTPRLQTAATLCNQTPAATESPLWLGVDLGTCDVVSMVVDRNGQPVAVCLDWADVVRDGIVWDFFGAVTIVRRHLDTLEQQFGRRFSHAATSFPPGTDPRISINVLESAGLEVSHVLDEPTAVADLLQLDNAGVVDIGGGTSEVAVISLGGIVVSKSVRCAGDACDAAIINYIKKRYNLLIGERTAESIKIQIGTAYPIDRNETMQIKGRNLMSGLPENVNITSDEVREALAEPLSRIVDAVRWTLEQTPPELAADIIDHGITLTGGGALLRGLDQLIHKETGMPVFIAEYPLDCVVEGTGKILENMDKYRDTLMDESRFA